MCAAPPTTSDDNKHCRGRLSYSQTSSCALPAAPPRQHRFAVHLRYAGIVTVRQQPETAKGVVFLGLEDETGNVQVIVRRELKDSLRSEVLRAKMLEVRGTWQRDGDATNIVAAYLEDLTPLLGRLQTESRDFR